MLSAVLLPYPKGVGNKALWSEKETGKNIAFRQKLEKDNQKQAGTMYPGPFWYSRTSAHYRQCDYSWDQLKSPRKPGKTESERQVMRDLRVSIIRWRRGGGWWHSCQDKAKSISYLCCLQNTDWKLRIVNALGYLWKIMFTCDYRTAFRSYAKVSTQLQLYNRRFPCLKFGEWLCLRSDWLPIAFCVAP